MKKQQTDDAKAQKQKSLQKLKSEIEARSNQALKPTWQQVRFTIFIYIFFLKIYFLPPESISFSCFSFNFSILKKVQNEMNRREKAKEDPLRKKGKMKSVYND